MHHAPMRAMMTFHHILSSRKIATLHQWAHELDVIGLMKTGYPGILVLTDKVPTRVTSVQEYVRRVKRLPWQTCDLRAIEEVPACVGGRSVGTPAMIGALAAALAPAAAAGAARRSGLAQFDRIKDISPVLRAADAPLAGTRPHCGWEEFYSTVMRTR